MYNDKIEKAEQEKLFELEEVSKLKERRIKDETGDPLQLRRNHPRYS